jgi:hypothetical protein
MLSLDDAKWQEMMAGYGVPFDPRPLLTRLQAGDDVPGVWKELWQELHHQGDVGDASFAVVPHLVRIHQQRGVPGWNTYALVATIELARDSAGNPPLPSWLQPGYDRALQELAATGAAELAKVRDPETVRSILATLAVAKGASVRQDPLGVLRRRDHGATEAGLR